MIGDVINIQERHFDTANHIFPYIQPLVDKGALLCIGVGGESGSGKSVTSYALQKKLADYGVKSIVLQMDDYFKLPPKTNHQNRLKSLEHVGIHEVNLDLLSSNIQDFKEGKSSFIKPLVWYNEDKIEGETIRLDEVKVLIVEGTYILENHQDYDFKIFIDRNYKDTYHNRMARNRDEKSDFVETILEIESKIIREYAKKADLILGKQYQIVYP